MSNSGSLSSKGIKFVSSDGNSNISVSEGKLSKLDLEVIESKFSNKLQNIDRRDEHVNDVMSVLGSSGQAGAERGGSLFTQPKSNAPDPEALLAFIDQTNAREDASELAKHPKLKFGNSSSDEGFSDEVNTDIDTAEVIGSDDYLADLVGANMEKEPVADTIETPDPIQHQTAVEEFDVNLPGTNEQPAETTQSYDEPLTNLNEQPQSELIAELENKIAELETKIADKSQELENTVTSHAQKLAKLQAEAELEADEAYQKGMEEGKANSQVEIDAIKTQLAQVSEDIPKALNNYLEELEEQMKDEVCTFSLSIAETFIRKEIGNHDILKETINSALSPIMNFKGVTLFLNPEIAELATSSGDFNLPNALAVEGDPQLEPGEAFVETDMGYIDATLKRRLEALRESYNNPSSSEA